MTEREIKLALEDPVRIRERLQRLGWRAARPADFERNTLYDTPGQRLRRAGRLLRVREFAGRGVLTFKLPQQVLEGHQVREEHEAVTDDATALHQIFQDLGFEPSWIYEKRRTRYERAQDPGVIEFDETPIGHYLELEGPADWIDAAAAELGYAPADYIARSYRALFEQWREETGRRDQRDMVFDGDV